MKLLWRCSMQREDIIWSETILLKMSNISEQFLKCCLEVSLGEKNLDLRQMQKTGYKIFRASLYLRIDSWQSIPVFLPGKFHEQRSLAVHGGHKEWDTTEYTHACTHTMHSISAECIPRRRVAGS